MKLFKNKYGGEIKNSEENNTLCLTTYCPHKDLHSKNIFQKTDFSLTYYKENKYFFAGCWHKSCKL